MPAAPSAIQRDINFSDKWYYFSQSGNNESARAVEKSTIENLLANSSNDQVRGNAEDQDDCQVYVRTGLHSSKSEKRTHVQVALGYKQWDKKGNGCHNHVTCHCFEDGSAECFGVSEKTTEKRVEASKKRKEKEEEEKKKKSLDPPKKKQKEEL